MLKSSTYPNLLSSGGATKQKNNADRDKALAEVEANSKARAIKTAKLRALRLAKEEADRVAAASAPEQKPAVKRRKTPSKQV